MGRMCYANDSLEPISLNNTPPAWQWHSYCPCRTAFGRDHRILFPARHCACQVAILTGLPTC